MVVLQRNVFKHRIADGWPELPASSMVNRSLVHLFTIDVCPVPDSLRDRMS